MRLRTQKTYGSLIPPTDLMSVSVLSWPLVRGALAHMEKKARRVARLRSASTSATRVFLRGQMALDFAQYGFSVAGVEQLADHSLLHCQSPLVGLPGWPADPGSPCFAEI